ncbi:hypothetical protein PoB_003826400 [Plakobranchus ocellatus]|uniref:ABC transmembrane type-1 domain-containing protein n=1 Tax=Plakobranchus ocellatus TaxID=259542 RepID=A0AAV4B079_9GAST|nr:hypothetical protein PoB_003826400 [Plakobranchus ocellatus]
MTHLANELRLSKTKVREFTFSEIVARVIRRPSREEEERFPSCGRHFYRSLALTDLYTKVLVRREPLQVLVGIVLAVGVKNLAGGVNILAVGIVTVANNVLVVLVGVVVTLVGVVVGLLTDTAVAVGVVVIVGIVIGVKVLFFIVAVVVVGVVVALVGVVVSLTVQAVAGAAVVVGGDVAV